MILAFDLGQAPQDPVALAQRRVRGAGNVEHDRHRAFPSPFQGFGKQVAIIARPDNFQDGYGREFFRIPVCLSPLFEVSVSFEEVLSLAPVVIQVIGGPEPGFLGLVDLNGNGVIEYAEVSDFVTEQQFARVDINNDGRIDCEDIIIVEPVEGEDEGEEPVEGEDPDEGEETEEGETGTYCPLPDDPFLLLDFVWPVLDEDGNGAVTPDELEPYLPEYVDDVFDLLDRSGDGAITLDEILALPPMLMGATNSVFAPTIGILQFVDLDGDWVLSEAEVLAFGTPALFEALDQGWQWRYRLR